MMEDDLHFYTNEQAAAQRAALGIYDPISPIQYFDAELIPRKPTKVERLTEVIFNHLFDAQRVHTNHDGSLIFEELMPSDLGDMHRFRRAFKPTERGRVLNHIKFDDGMIGYYGQTRGDSNGRLLSDPDGSLVRVPYISGETVSLPRAQRVLLTANLVGLAIRHS